MPLTLTDKLPARAPFPLALALALAAVLALCAPAFADPAVERSGQVANLPGSSFPVAFTISAGDSPLSAFDLAEFVPSGWTITNWSISGYPKDHISIDTRSRSYQGKVYNAYHWKFSSEFANSIVLSYQLSIPSGAQNGSEHSVVTLWIYPGGFNSKTTAIRIGPPAEAAVCGDGRCAGAESCSACPKDCGVCWTQTCGDGTCGGNESCATCSADCSACATQTTAGGMDLGDLIFGSPETGQGLLQQYGPIAGGILLGLAGILLVIFAVRKVSSLPPRRQPAQAQYLPQPAPQQPVAPSSFLPQAAPIQSLPEAEGIRDRVLGRVPTRVPVSREAPRSLSTLERIAALKKTMIKISKIADDLEKKT